MRVQEELLPGAWRLGVAPSDEVVERRAVVLKGAEPPAGAGGREYTEMKPGLNKEIKAVP